MPIPASEIVSVTPSVISAAGAALDLNGLILTQSTSAPVGHVVKYSTADDVKKAFGVESVEANMAAIYFNGYTNSTKTPGELLFSRMVTESSDAQLRGGSVDLTLDELKKIEKGDIGLTANGKALSAKEFDFSEADSFSDAATLLENALMPQGEVTCSFDSNGNAFVITSAKKGSAGSIGYATGEIAIDIQLTEDLAASISEGSDASTPAGVMDTVVQDSQNWATFTTTWACSLDELEGFSDWVGKTKLRYLFVGHDLADNATTKESWGGSNTNEGVCPVYGDETHAALILGYAASLDFTRLNGRTTLAFRRQGGIKPSVTDATTAKSLSENGYNFYGQYATSKEDFEFIYPGQVSGTWLWADTYLNQIWLNANIQLALFNLLVNVPSIPYMADGYALTESACLDPILAAVNFGAIRPGVELSNAQRAQIINAAGQDITDSLLNKGFYVQVLPAGAAMRVTRSSPSVTIFYMDGGSIQFFNVSSIAIL